MRSPLFIACLVLYLAAACAAQYRFDTWTTDNGLPQNGVRAITQTPEGYLWFTTFDGLVRFDGVKFTTFNKSNTQGIINNRFTGIFSEPDGTIYATTMEDGILTVYRNGVFSSFTSDQVPGEYIDRIERNDNGELRFLAVGSDHISRSWYRLRDGQFELVEAQKRVKNESLRVFEGRSGTKWTVSLTGVTEVKDNRSTFYPIDLTAVNFRLDLFEDDAGGLWIGEHCVHHISNGQLRTFGKQDGLPDSTVYFYFWQEADGSVWASSGGLSTSGIGLLQFRDDRVSIWGKGQISNKNIQSVFSDREGIVWLATDKGISRRRKEVIQSYSIEDGLDHSEIYPLYRDHSDNIWIGSSKGLSLYHNGKFEPLDVKPSQSDIHAKEAWRKGVMSVQSLWEDPSGTMWVGVDGGIYLIKDGVATPLYLGAHVYSIKNDSAGNVWAATNLGILRFNDYKLTAQYSTHDGLPNDFMTIVFEDSRGTLWFGGFGGLTRYDNGKLTNYTAREGLTGNYVRTIFEDSDGTVWIGTYDEGLSRFKDGKFTNYKVSDGLFNSGVFAIEEDDAGFFWISSNHGIYRVAKQELNDFANGKIAKINSVGYGKADGMLSNECNGGRQPASLKDKDGKFWFPTQDGVAIVDPTLEKTNPLPPTVVVESILVDRKPIDFRGGAAIEPGQKDIEIQYTGISLIKSDQIKFKYRLEGHDADWIDAGTRRSVFYSSLPYGNYTFHVMAANSDGIWSESEATVNLTLKPFFFQTRSFYFLMIFCGAGLLLLVWKVSVHQLEAREKRLTKLVKERTAELAKANENLQNLANSDGLTKIGNRRRFESFLADEWHRAVRFKTEISLVMIDIDHFKLYNDTYGHQAGDECLQRVAEAFAEAIKRPTDLVARFGGEEFALVLGGTDSAGALQIAEQAIQNLRELEIPHDMSATCHLLTVSAGVATMFANFELTEIDLIKAADRALYQAKKDGRNRIHIYDHLSRTTKDADVLISDRFESV